MPPKAAAKKKGKKKGKRIDEKVAVKLQAKLRAACIDTAPAKFFKKFDKDKSGDMNAKELEKMIRVSLKIPEKDLSMSDVKELIRARSDGVSTRARARLSSKVALRRDRRRWTTMGPGR